jgi:hypothetical protein
LDKFDKNTLERWKAALQQKKLNDMATEKTTKHSASTEKTGSTDDLINRPGTSTPQGPASRDDVSDGLHVSPSTPQHPTTGNGLPNLGDDNGEKVVKHDSSSLFVPERPPEPPVVSSGSSAESSKSSGITESESMYGGLIGFENAILETGDEQVKRAMIQKVKSKRFVETIGDLEHLNRTN